MCLDHPNQSLSRVEASCGPQTVLKPGLLGSLLKQNVFKFFLALTQNKNILHCEPASMLVHIYTYTPTSEIRL